jgi:hypothetical protein
LLIIIMNGPPDSGKDTAADYLVEKHGFTKLEMKSALRKVAHKIASIQWGHRAVEMCDDLEFDKQLKSTKKTEAFGNRTWREFLIWLSEHVAKPIFGSSVFATAAIKEIREAGSELIVFSDGGFQVEVDEIAKAFPDAVRIVHLYRSGCTYEGDSRGYIEAMPGEYLPVALDGDQGLVQAKLELDELVKSWSKHDAVH